MTYTHHLANSVYSNVYYSDLEKGDAPVSADPKTLTCKIRSPKPAWLDKDNIPLAWLRQNFVVAKISLFPLGPEVIQAK